MTQRFRASAAPLAFWALASLLLFVGLGCTDASKDDPKLFPVSGSVKLKNGNPVASAFIQFAGTHATDLTTNGLTDADGNFTVFTIMIKGNRKLSGAPAGDYDVTVSLPLAADQSGGGTIKLPAKLTVKPQDDNNFPITIDPPRKGGK